MAPPTILLVGIFLFLITFLEIFFHALETGHYKCWLGPKQALPMIYIDECIDLTVKYLKAPQQNLKRSVYNLGGVSFTPEELVAEVQKLIPGFTVEYELCETRSKIADSWPQKLDDRLAQQEWGLSYNVSTYELAHKILENIEPKYKEGKVLNMERTPLKAQLSAVSATRQF